jgi:hypothetical protein
MDIRLCTLANEFDRSTDLGGRDGLELLPTMTIQFNVKACHDIVVTDIIRTT